MSYENAVTTLYALGHELTQSPSHKFDLAHMRTLLESLGNPERKFPGVLIAGTNGKGSTAATLASIMYASGLKTGLYTSPHLIRVNERIQINGLPVPDESFTVHFDAVNQAANKLVSTNQLPWHPSFFEMLTAIAFRYFAENKIEIAVLEVGMGGRLDATNVIDPLVSVITDISLDHQNFLGDSLTEIAGEKAGIIRKDGVVVTLPQHPEANDVIGNRILKLGAKAVNAVPYVPPVSPGSAEHFKKHEDFADRRLMHTRYPLEVMAKQIIVESSLAGRHQFRNVALAIASAVELAAQGFPVTAESIARGIRETSWPGRFQVLRARDDSPEFVLDVAHNPAGAWALRSTLSTAYENKHLIIVFGAMRDKAIGEIAEILFPVAEAVIATQADNLRAATVAEIRDAARRTATDIESAPSVSTAISRAEALAGPDGIVVITGSIYVVGEAMRVLGVRTSIPPMTHQIQS